MKFYPCKKGAEMVVTMLKGGGGLPIDFKRFAMISQCEKDSYRVPVFHRSVWWRPTNSLLQGVCGTYPSDHKLV